MGDFSFKINYNGKSKVIRRLCDRVNNLAALGETHDTAYYGDLGKIAHDHSQLRSGNPHNVTADDLGLGNVVARLDAVMYALGMFRTWITHNNEPIIDHEGDFIVFHGVGNDRENYILWH